jgi:ribose 5-phosphate isomerase A
MNITELEETKKKAAFEAIKMIKPGMIVGLGTGSTSNYAIDFLGQKVKQGLKIKAVSTSFQSQQIAQSHGIELLFDVPKIDFAFDGADRADQNGNLIKGWGGALVREKIVAESALNFCIIIDSTKLISNFINQLIPIEIIPMAENLVRFNLQQMGAKVELRERNGKVFITDNQNIILDSVFSNISNLQDLNKKIKSLTGVVDHGLFLDLAKTIIIASHDTGLEIKTF